MASLKSSGREAVTKLEKFTMSDKTTVTLSRLVPNPKRSSRVPDWELRCATALYENCRASASRSLGGVLARVGLGPIGAPLYSSSPLTRAFVCTSDQVLGESHGPGDGLPSRLGSCSIVSH